MKRICCLLMLLMAALTGRSQNLIRNPGFETYTSCPTGYSQLDRAPPWINPNKSTPDYFNKCGTINVTIPVNVTGYQPTHSGNAYAGIFIWKKGVEVREYLEAPLSSPLLPESTYHFEMFVNRANSSQYTANTVGAYFSDTLISDPATFGVLPFTPQVRYTGTAGIDSAGWTSVRGDYRAFGGERYIVIGNFKPDSLTDTAHVYSSTSGIDEVYFLIDDVSLILKTGTGTGMAGVPAALTTAGPNPFSEKLLIHVPANGIYELLLTDMASKVIIQKRFSVSFELNTSLFPAGMYFYQINGREGVIARDRILKL